jgi:hypothetical protein
MEAILLSAAPGPVNFRFSSMSICHSQLIGSLELFWAWRVYFRLIALRR